MTGLQRLLGLIGAPPIHSDDHQVGYGQMWSLFRRCFLDKYWPSLLLVLVLSGLAALQPFLYAWAWRIIADDIVQVQLMTTEQSPAMQLEPTLPGEKRRFAFDDGKARTSLTSRLAVRTGRPVHEKFLLLAGMAIVLLAISGAMYIGHFVRAERLIQIGINAEFWLRQKLHSKMLVLPQSYHDQNSPGKLMTCLFSDVATIHNTGLRLPINALIDFITLLVGLAIVFSIDVQLASLVILGLPAYAVCYRCFRTRLKIINNNLREREGKLNSHIANRIKHFLLVKSFGRETGEAVDFSRQAKPLLRDTLAASVLNTSFTGLCGLITGLCIHGILWLGAIRLRDGQMTLGTLLMFYSSVALLFAPATKLVGKAAQFHRLKAVAARVLRLLGEPITITDPPNPRPAPTTAPQLRFEHVSMCYEQNPQPVLEDVSFVLPPGRRLCVMGPSGSGRSTMAKLACRLYDTTRGAVLLDGIDLRHFKLADLRRIIGFVPQEAIVFGGSIEQNIRYGSEHAPQQAVIDAAQTAQIHGFIQQLPNQYQTQTSECGLTLSGGQRQRINLARALLHDPKVLVLDDCTSSLDALTEAQLMEAFATTLRNRTVMIITHRISIALECDMVLMLDNGRQVEYGPPRILIQRGGPFSALYRLETERVHHAGLPD